MIAIDDAEIEDDLVRDMTDVLTSFCARLYEQALCSQSREERWRPCDDAGAVHRQRHRRAGQADAQATTLRSSLHRHRPLLLQLNDFTNGLLEKFG